MKRHDFLMIFRLIADFLYAYGFLLLLPFGVSLWASDITLALIFGSEALLLIAGCWWARHTLSSSGVTSHHAAIALALTWALLSLLSSLPFVAAGMPWIDALFESFSAWTDTGLTMVPHPEILPLSLGMFRILIQWISGLGIVMFILFLRNVSPRAAHSLFQAEGRFEDFSRDIWSIGRTVMLIYVGYTLAGTLALWGLGVPFFEALAHAITSLSTGGFSTNSVGVGVYGALPTVVAMLLMLSGGISFSSHHALLSGNLKKFWRNPEVRTLLIIVVGATGLLTLSLWLLGDGEIRILDSAFYTITTISTCGAGTTLALSQTPDVFVFIVILLMVSGSIYGSTSGALKLWRLLILGKAIQREIRRPFYPEGTPMPIKMGNNNISERQIMQIGVYVWLYLAIAILGSLVFMLFGYRPLHALFTVFSAQGNVGLNTMPDALYYGMPVLLKGQLIFHMLIGRMEIFPFLYLLRVFWVSSKKVI